jgi:hypothetical protein
MIDYLETRNLPGFNAPPSTSQSSISPFLGVNKFIRICKFTLQQSSLESR